MKLFSKRLLFDLLLMLVLLGTGYYYKDEIRQFADNQLAQLNPCGKPIIYSIGTFDPNFGITKEEFLKTTTEAAGIWETSIGKPLFKYEANTNSNSELKINLIYDTRQKATDEQKKIKTGIDSKKNDYEILKIKYSSLSTLYATEKASLEKMTAEFQTQRDIYSKEVDYWNAQGGAPKEKFQELEKERVSLNKQADQINQKKDNFNKQVEVYNALATELNNLASDIKQQVNAFNTTGTPGEEFDEGEYKTIDGKNKMINIYQFENKSKLLRVLAHELGHALGIDHVNDPNAIMYRLNESPNEKLTTDDITALKAICQIK